jgi:tetratricopeptide (TPR) repeat protein
MSDRLQSAWQLQQAGAARSGAHLRRHHRSEPRNFDAFNQLGMIYLQTGTCRCRSLFTAAAQINSQSPELFLQQGLRASGSFQAKRRTRLFRPGAGAEAGLCRAHANNRGVTLLAMKRHKEALACFDRIIETNPNLHRATTIAPRAARIGAATGSPCRGECGFARNAQHGGGAVQPGSALTRLGRHRKP